MQIKKVKIPIFYGTLLIVISEDYNEVIKELQIETYLDLDLYGAFTEYRIDKKGHPEYIVCIDSKVKNHLIAHECTHLINFLFNHCGIELDRTNDEVQAYITAWFFKKIKKFKNKVERNRTLNRNKTD